MRFFYLFFALLGFGWLSAQNDVSATFIIPNIEADNGTNRCVPVTAIDFTSGVEFSFALRWDAPANGGFLTFDRIQNISPDVPFLDITDFNTVDYAAAGLITVEWGNYPNGGSCSDANGSVTIDDNTVLFEVCFDIAADAPLASNHPIEFFDLPDDPFTPEDESVDILFNKPAQCNTFGDAFPGTVDGSITIGVEALKLRIPENPGEFQPGDTYCIDIEVESGFDNLKGLQFGIFYDNTVLRAISADANTDLPGNADRNFNLFEDVDPPGQSVYVLWNDLANDVPHSLPDGARFATVCFEVIGECGEATNIEIREGVNPKGVFQPIDAAGENAALASLPVLTSGTTLNIENCNSRGFDVVMGCPDGPITFGQTDVCVEVQAGEDFVDMNFIEFLLSFNPDVLEFTGFRNFNSRMNINQFNDLNDDNAGDGRLTFSWDNFSPVTLAEGEVMFEACYTAVGFGGTSPMVVSEFNNDPESTSLPNFDGINPDNCAITIEQPNGVALTFPDRGYNSTSTTCFPLTATGFTNVTSATILVSYQEAELEFVSFTSAVAGLTGSSLAPSLLRLEYSGPPISVADGAPIGEFCFRADDGVTPGGECSQVNSLNPQITTTESEGNPVPVESFAGDACILFPNGFGLVVGQTEGFITEQVCVPVSVTRFTDVSSFSVEFVFDPTQLSWDAARTTGSPIPNFSSLNFDDTNAGVGRILVEWVDPAPGGQFVADTDTVQVFELCFTGGSDDVCVDIEARDGAEEPTVAGGTNGSIIYQNGGICLQDKIDLLSLTFTPATCTDVDDATISYQTGPRPNGDNIFIRVNGPNGRVRRGNTGTAEGILPGLNQVILFNANGSVRLDTSIMVTADPANAAVAVFDEDEAQLSCGDSPIALIGSRDNVGVNWRLFIIQEDGTTRRIDEGEVSADGNITAATSEAGQVILQVFSEQGCSARDTMLITPPENPVADAGDDISLTCNGTAVTLGGPTTSTDNNAQYQWRLLANNGTVLEENVGTDATLEVTQAGRYELLVTFPSLGCSATDRVLVRNESDPPLIRLPREAALNCDGSEITLSIGEAEENVSYEWRVLDDPTVIETGTDFSTDQVGTYVVASANSATGCNGLDTVSVIPSTGSPEINVPAQAFVMPCAPDTLLLEGITFANVNPGTRYRWRGTDGGQVVITDLSVPVPRVVAPGTYGVTVTAGACSDSLMITVAEPAFPDLDAGAEQQLDCNQSVTLSAAATVTTNEAITYQWSLDGQPVPMGAASSVAVSSPGRYFVTATTTAGCMSEDSVDVLAPVGFPVYTLADTVRGLGCAPATVTLSLENADRQDYSVVWTGPDGETIGTSYSEATGMEGMHFVTITNPETTCSTTDSVLVIDDAAIIPVVAFRRNNLEISCGNSRVWLDASLSTQGPDIVYFWEVVSGGEPLSSQGNDSLQVRSEGVYRLTVTNEVTRCTASREITVDDVSVFPNATAGPDQLLTCDVREATISITIQDQPNDYQVQWFGPAGVQDLPRDVTEITVTTPGRYDVIVVDPVSSCITNLQVSVTDQRANIADIVFQQPDTFSCSNDFVMIDASATQLNSATPEGIVWSSLDGNSVLPPSGQLIVNVNGPGDYELAITDASGCTTRDTVRVEAGEGTPFAQAGANLEVECGEMPQLNGSASTPVPSPGIEYSWTSLDGGTIVSGANTDRPFVSGPGTYQLVVFNTANSCSDTSTTLVTLSETVAADAGTDFTTCEATVSVTGNLPPGTSGVWTAFDDATAVWSANGNIATVSELGEGLGLVWTLSAGPGCENYSADTVRISPEAPPQAVDDVLEVGGTNLVGTIDLLQNDIRTGPVRVSLLNEPSFGEILSNLNGTITFESPQGFTGETVIEYEVCSNVCEGLCSRGTLTIFADAEGRDPAVYNAITPNGDGMNDVFYFEKLGRNPMDFPDSEMVIFNRWGDIIFQAQPYNNDWNGTSDGGTPVAEGTYYYVLRLNVGEGDIIRGNVTVVR